MLSIKPFTETTYYSSSKKVHARAADTAHGHMGL